MVDDGIVILSPKREKYMITNITNWVAIDFSFTMIMMAWPKSRIYNWIFFPSGHLTVGSGTWLWSLSIANSSIDRGSWGWLLGYCGLEPIFLNPKLERCVFSWGLELFLCYPLTIHSKRVLSVPIFWSFPRFDFKRGVHIFSIYGWFFQLWNLHFA